MVRGYHTRISSRSVLGKRRRYGPSRFGKRRRITRRFRRTTRSYTNRNSSGVSNGGYRTRRTSARQWRSILWRDTIASSHWRSLGTGSQIANTPNSVFTASVIEIVPGGSFWTAAGGTVPIDGVTPPPVFTGDIILRGGVIKLTLTNTPNADGLGSDPVRATIFACWRNKFHNVSFALPPTVPLSWDPSVLAEFNSSYGKVLYKKEVLLKGDGEVFDMTHRMRVQKIDRAVYNQGGSRVTFIILLSQTSNTELVPLAESVTITDSINFSFVGDAST